jgi:hypothetical protein
MQTTTVLIEELFSEPPTLFVPSIDDRYRYKKHGGDSDSPKQRDEFE